MNIYTSQEVYYKNMHHVYQYEYMNSSVDFGKPAQ